VATALAWALAAARVRARLPGWALAAIGSPDTAARADDQDDVVLGAAGARRIAAEIDRHDAVLAADIARRLHEAGAIDARPLIAGLLARAAPEEQVEVASALWRCAQAPVPVAPSDPMASLSTRARADKDTIA